MLQDTLQHVQAVQPESGIATHSEATQQTLSHSHAWKQHVAVTDTVAPDPKQLKPLPAGEPLTMIPDMLENDYWADGKIHFERSEFAKKLDSISGIDGTTITVKPTGIAGDPVPYLFRNDNFVTITLLLSFILVVWVTSRSRHYLHEQIKDFFHERERENMFTERTQTELRGQIFLIFQTCFVLGILFFDFTQEKQIEVFNQVSPYKILSTSVGICSLYYLLKVAIYAFVNSIFFERKKCERWSETYMVNVLALGLALLPVTLLVVYFDLSFKSLSVIFICLLVLDKILLLYKSSRIFFNYPWGWIHLFLYFCTLEVAPILILFRALIYANSFLLTIN